MTTIKVELAEALVIGPNDSLIIRFPRDFIVDEDDIEHFRRELASIGINDRTLVIFADEIEFTKIEGD